MSQTFYAGQEIQFVYHNTLRQVTVKEVKTGYIITSDINNPDIIKSYSVSKMSCISELR